MRKRISSHNANKNKRGGEATKHFLEARSPTPMSDDLSYENDQSEELNGIIHQGQTLSQNKM